MALRVSAITVLSAVHNEAPHLAHEILLETRLPNYSASLRTVPNTAECFDTNCR